MNYFVDANRGDDAAAGTSPEKPWKSFVRVNALRLAPGDRVTISPGVYRETLAPAGQGSQEQPVEFVFTAGRYDLQPDPATPLFLHISNSNDAPDQPKTTGLLLRDVKHMRFIGHNSHLVAGGRMSYFVHDRAEDISYEGLTFDLKRPTVSEFCVLETHEGSATVQMAEGSDYAVNDGVFAWVGDLGSGRMMWQEAIPAEGRCWRLGFKDWFTAVVAEAVEPGVVRFNWKTGPCPLKAGRHYQLRYTKRDSVGGFNTRSRNLSWRNCRFHALAGMGIVSQFTENLEFHQVDIVPPEGTRRTCPAWGDMLHFSGCRGTITITDCRMSGSQDDPINVHGTHLRLIEKTARHQVTVRFMHAQTYGFAAFQPGDQVEFVNPVTLLAFATNSVVAVEQLSDTDWALTLGTPVAEFAENDVIDNVSWYPDLIIRNCHVTMDATRGLLFTTRGRVVVENNTFMRTRMSAIAIHDDAKSWFESGPVHDVMIRGNRFIECGEPVILIGPENQSAKPEEPVHRNIRIENNTFQGDGLMISAKSVKGLSITGNQVAPGTLRIEHTACTEVHIADNETAREEKTFTTRLEYQARVH